MSLEDEKTAIDTTSSATEADASALGASEQQAYDAAWDRIMADGSDDADDAGPAAQERDETGKFKAATTAEPEAEAEGTQVEEAKPAGVTLPPNMTADLADVFEGMAPEKASKLTAWADKLHRQMSDQGRQIAAFRPFDEVVRQHNDYFASDGAPQPAQALDLLMKAQKRLDTDPIAGIRWLAESYGVTDQVFGGNALSGDAAALRQTIADLRQQITTMASPTSIRSEVDAMLKERAAVDEVSRFAQSKPLFAEVEAVLPNFIPMARAQAGEGAANSAVLDLAYDMAVNALPTTRAKVQAAAKPAAIVPDAKRIEAVKKASSVNVKSAPTGQQRYSSEEEAMSAAYDRLMAS